MSAVRLPPGHRAARAVTALALVVVFGATGATGVASHTFARLVDGGQLVAERVREAWQR
jgi:hypothetical protein